MNVLPIILVVGGLILAAIFGYFAWLAEKKRREALAALASELGWRFDASHDRSHDDQYAHFEIFRRGHSRVAKNTITGTATIDGRPYPARMGDFRYKVTQHSGKSTRTVTYRFSYLILHVPFAAVPNTLIRPEGLFDKFKGALGFDDIDFESSEFSRRFYVSGADKRFAYDVCHPRMMEFLLATRPPCVDIEHGRCCLSDGRKRWSAEEFRGHLAWIKRFFDLWPDHLTKQLDDQAHHR